MFIHMQAAGYDRDGQQFSRGRFLLVFSRGHELYAAVRHVSLHQFGHFMMGFARIAGQRITVSGAYGNDGLPDDYDKLTPQAQSKLTPLPADLTEIFWKGDGHNSTGNEREPMLKWALQTFPEVTK